MISMKKLFGIVLIAAVALVSCSQKQDEKVQIYQSSDTYEPVVTTLAPVPAGQTPKNIILLIGDGMGLTHVSAAWVVNHGRLNLDAFPYIGLSRTYCSDTLITDSGAGGTALACGKKTKKTHVGSDPDGNPMTSLIGYAQKQGMRTGISVVCRLCDATPADFCCHTDNRDLYDDILADYLECGADYIAGGGMYFLTHRADERNIYDEMGEKGYHLYDQPEALAEALELPIFAVLADSEYVVAPERGTLFQDQTMQAVRMLDNERGFFLMAEGSCIDDWSHANDLERTIEEVLDFDRMVGEVLRWAEQDGQTLVVVVADHETGAPTLLGGSIERGEVEVHFQNESHSGIKVPVYAYGPGAEQFTGIMENAEVGRRMIDLLPAMYR